MARKFQEGISSLSFLWRLLSLALWLCVSAPASADEAAPVYPGVSGALREVHQAEIEAQVRLQGSGHLAPEMTLITNVGVGKFNWILIVALFFFVSPRLATRLAIFFMIGLWLRELFGLTLQSPRPFWVDARVLTFAGSELPRSYGLPSGHAMMGSAFWLYLAAESRQRWALCLAGALALLIALSRVYLGLHFFTDVALGLCLGPLYCWGWRKFEPDLLREWNRLTVSRRIILSIDAGAGLLLAGFLVRWFLVSDATPPWPQGVNARRLLQFADYGGALMGTGIALASLRRWPVVQGRWLPHLIILLIAGGIALALPHSIIALLLKPSFSGLGELPRILCRFALRVGEGALLWFMLPRLLRLVPGPPSTPASTTPHGRTLSSGA